MATGEVSATVLKADETDAHILTFPVPIHRLVMDETVLKASAPNALRTIITTTILGDTVLMSTAPPTQSLGVGSDGNSQTTRVSTNQSHSTFDQVEKLYGQHRLESIPQFRTFQGAQLVEATRKYSYHRCINCYEKVRTYCCCTPGVVRCRPCHVSHMQEIYENQV
jgi:hypothetical protein